MEEVVTGAYHGGSRDRGLPWRELCSEPRKGIANIDVAESTICGMIK